MDLDLSISPDVFGHWAFDSDKPVSRMLPGSTPCEFRLMLPDAKLGIDGFHDVIIENLTASPIWRSSHVSPADITSLRRRWPKAVFSTLRRRASDVERLRRDAPKRADKAFRYSGPGFCGVCDTRVYTALDTHMIACHLELGQLWRCPVEWCAVWKGYVDRECPVPRWRLAREGPFLKERSPESIRSLGRGCAFRTTTYRASDYAAPVGDYGFHLHHPRFVEWIGVPQSAGLIEFSGSQWIDKLSHDQAVTAAVHL